MPNYITYLLGYYTYIGLLCPSGDPNSSYIIENNQVSGINGEELSIEDTEECCTMYPGLDIPFGNLAHHLDTQPKECCALCRLNPSCRGWVVKGTNCFLKDRSEIKSGRLNNGGEKWVAGLMDRICSNKYKKVHPIIETVVEKLEDDESLAEKKTHDLVEKFKKENAHYRCKVNGTIALTFDDGPSLVQTKPLLSLLKREGIKATFFINGENYQNIENPLVQSIIQKQHAEGHLVASHTWSHPFFANLKTEGELIEEMDKISRAIEMVLASTPPFKKPSTKLMRPPFGRFGEKEARVLKRLGYMLVMWDIDTGDWDHPGDTEAGVDAYRKYLEGTDPSMTPGFIGLHHDIQEGTVDLARAVIKYARDQGYRFVPLEECIGLQ